MPLPRSPACPLSRTRLEANPPNRDHPSFRAARIVRRRVAESAAQSGSGRSACPISVRVLMALSRSRLDGDLPFIRVVQSAVPTCRLWYVSLPYLKFDTNLMPKRSSTKKRCDSTPLERGARRTARGYPCLCPCREKSPAEPPISPKKGAA